MNSPINSSNSGASPVPDEAKASVQEEDLWTTPEVARHLHVSLKTIHNLRKKGLPFVQLGGAIRFVPQEIREYLINSRRLSSHRLRQLVRKGASS